VLEGRLLTASVAVVVLVAVVLMVVQGVPTLEAMVEHMVEAAAVHHGQTVVVTVRFV